MNKYGVKLYPNNESDYYEVEADNVEEAIEEAERYAHQNSFFMAVEDDVELLEEDLEWNGTKKKIIYLTIYITLYYSLHQIMTKEKS